MIDMGVVEFLTLFTRASKLLRGATDEAMSHHGVRVGQNVILEALWQGDGLTPGELAERLGLATPTVVKSANRMATSGLLTRRGDNDDRRLVRLYLTKAGRAAQSGVERAREDLEHRAMARLTATERRYLLSALRKLIDEFSDSPPLD
jgi:MarR family transcriptional regulator for hemolysin